MTKVIEFILKRGGEVKITAIPAPPESPRNINHCSEKVFEHEVDNTKAIYRIVKMSHDEEDWATWNFMQWFVKEQIEEETLAMELIDKMKIAGGENAGSTVLYSINKDLETAPDDIRSAEDVTAENP